MYRVLVHAGALLCALAVLLVAYVLTGPTPLQLAGEAVAVALLGVGLCLSRDRAGGGALAAAALAAAGILMVLLATPADAAGGHKGTPVLSVVEAPAAAPVLALAAPAVPQQVVVKVAQAEPADTSIALPLADWTAAARNTVMTVLLALWGLAKNKLPAPVLWALRLYGENKLVEMAVNFGINAVPGASKGVPLTVDVGNAVLAKALQWVIDNVPGFIVSMLGGEAGIQAKIFAALHLEPDASAIALGVPAAG